MYKRHIHRNTCTYTHVFGLYIHVKKLGNQARNLICTHAVHMYAHMHTVYTHTRMYVHTIYAHTYMYVHTIPYAYIHA